MHRLSNVPILPPSAKDFLHVGHCNKHLLELAEDDRIVVLHGLGNEHDGRCGIKIKCTVGAFSVRFHNRHKDCIKDENFGAPMKEDNTRDITAEVKSLWSLPRSAFVQTATDADFLEIIYTAVASKLRGEESQDSDEFHSFHCEWHGPDREWSDDARNVAAYFLTACLKPTYEALKFAGKWRHALHDAYALAVKCYPDAEAATHTFFDRLRYNQLANDMMAHFRNVLPSPYRDEGKADLDEGLPDLAGQVLLGIGLRVEHRFIELNRDHRQSTKDDGWPIESFAPTLFTSDPNHRDWPLPRKLGKLRPTPIATRLHSPAKDDFDDCVDATMDEEMFIALAGDGSNGSKVASMVRQRALVAAVSSMVRQKLEEKIGLDEGYLEPRMKDIVRILEDYIAAAANIAKQLKASKDGYSIRLIFVEEGQRMMDPLSLDNAIARRRIEGALKMPNGALLLQKDPIYQLIDEMRAKLKVEMANGTFVPKLAQPGAKPTTRLEMYCGAEPIAEPWHTRLLEPYDCHKDQYYLFCPHQRYLLAVQAMLEGLKDHAKEKPLEHDPVKMAAACEVIGTHYVRSIYAAADRGVQNAECKEMAALLGKHQEAFMDAGTFDGTLAVIEAAADELKAEHEKQHEKVLIIVEAKMKNNVARDWTADEEKTAREFFISEYAEKKTSRQNGILQPSNEEYAFDDPKLPLEWLRRMVNMLNEETPIYSVRTHSLLDESSAKLMDRQELIGVAATLLNAPLHREDPKRAHHCIARIRSEDKWEEMSIDERRPYYIGGLKQKEEHERREKEEADEAVRRSVFGDPSGATASRLQKKLAARKDGTPLSRAQKAVNEIKKEALEAQTLEAQALEAKKAEAAMAALLEEEAEAKAKEGLPSPSKKKNKKKKGKAKASAAAEEAEDIVTAMREVGLAGSSSSAGSSSFAPPPLPSCEDCEEAVPEATKEAVVDVSEAKPAPAPEPEVEGPPEELVCPLTHELMIDPVITTGGYTYERGPIERWLATHDTDPMTGEPLSDKTLRPNMLVRSMCRKYSA